MTRVGRVVGGQRTEAFIRNALAAQGVESIEIGYFASDRYPDGTPVSNVAAWQEFGTERIPERPFMRTAIGGVTDTLTATVAEAIDPETMTVDDALARRLAETVKAAIATSIRTFSTPPNAPATRRYKRGGSPLVRSGWLARAVRYRIRR